MTEVLIMGTSSAVPTHDRHLSGTILSYSDYQILFDCGEGTQFHLRKAGKSLNKIKFICITHLHGDHIFGLPGLISSMANRSKDDHLSIIGPLGLKDILDTHRRHQQFYIDFELDIIELGYRDSPEVIIDTPLFSISTVSLDHRIPSFGFRFQEKNRPGHIDIEKVKDLGIKPGPLLGKLKAGIPVEAENGKMIVPEQVIGPEIVGNSFCYVTDTRYCNRAEQLALNADVLMHEATFLHELVEKANQTGHSTAYQAAWVAKNARVKKLILFHFSARYGNLNPLLEEAKSIFPHTVVGKEFERFELSEFVNG